MRYSKCHSILHPDKLAWSLNNASALSNGNRTKITMLTPRRNMKLKKNKSHVSPFQAVPQSWEAMKKLVLTGDKERWGFLRPGQQKEITSDSLILLTPNHRRRACKRHDGQATSHYRIVWVGRRQVSSKTVVFRLPKPILWRFVCSSLTRTRVRRKRVFTWFLYAVSELSEN